MTKKKKTAHSTSQKKQGPRAPRSQAVKPVKTAAPKQSAKKLKKSDSIPAVQPIETPVVPVAEMTAAVNAPAVESAVTPSAEAAADTASVPAAPKGSGKGKKSQKPPAEPAVQQDAPVVPVPEQKPPAPVKHLVCLLGDEGLVQEYSAMFQERGIAVLELKSLSSLKNSAKKITAAFELTLAGTARKRENLTALDESLPEHVPVVSASVCATILSQTQQLKHCSRFIGISAFPTLLANPLVELAPSLHTSKTTADAVTALLASAKKETAMVQDSVGMVMPRILCQIINEALFTVQNDVATPADIDEAMKHGTNYPHGPIAWGEMIGFANIAAVLDAIYDNHHEERYRAAPLLRQMAMAGVFWNKQQ